MKAILVAASVGAIAVVALGGWVFSRGSSGSGGTVPATVRPAATGASDTSEAGGTAGGDGTLVITAPSNSGSSNSGPSTSQRDSGTAPTAAPGDRLVADDTGVFTVSAPNDFEIDTTPVDANGEQIPQVMAAANLADFRSDFVTVGYIVNALPDVVASTPHDAIVLAGPREQDCLTLSAETDIDTEVGPAVVQTAQGCGQENGTVAVIALVDSQSGMTFVVYAQGGGDTESVRTLAQTVLESIFVS